MRPFTPVIEITVDGKPVSSAFYSVLVNAKIRQEEGESVDTLQITLDDRGNQLQLPRKGAKVTVKLGYRETGVVNRGEYEVEKVQLTGSAESGEFMAITANAVDLRKEAKGEGRKAHENKSFGEIVRAEAAKMKVQVKIAPELASIKFDYKLRWTQSRVDFITRLANEVGGVAKFAGGKLVVQKRGSGQSGSGADMGALTILKADCSSWDIDPSGRMQYGSIEASWIDKASGKRKIEKQTTGLQGPAFTLREDFPDQARAKKAAEAEKGRLNRGTGSGHFEIYGRPQAQAGQKVIAVGFRDGIDGEWMASAVEDTFTAGPSGGYTTTVEIKAPEAGKKDAGD